MMHWQRAIGVGVAALWLLTAQEIGAATNAWSRAISASGQIFVFADNPLQSAALADFCEDVREKLLKRLDESSQWRAPIVVVARQRPAGSVVPMPGETVPLRGGVVSIAGRLRFQIDMEAPPPVDRTQFVQLLTGVLCSELANRKLPTVRAGQALAQVPNWLVAGLVNRLTGEPREATLRVLKEAVTSSTVPSFASVTGTAPPAPGGEVLHRAACEVLVEALEGQPDGRTKLRRFLMGLDAGQPWQASFGQAFGESVLEGPVIERWWAIVMSRPAGMIVPQTLSWAQTRQKFADALRVENADLASGLVSGALPQGFTRRYTRTPEKLVTLLVPVEMWLLSLSPVSHPLYRPAISSYLEGIGWVRKKKLRQFEMCLSRAAAERRRADQNSEAIGRYVGSVEASLFPEDSSNRFTNWFHSQAPAAPRAAEPIVTRQYLDRVESEIAR